MRGAATDLAEGTLTVTGGFVEGYATGKFQDLTGGGSNVQDTEIGQIATIGNATTASGTDITITNGHSTTSFTMIGGVSGGGVEGHFSASSGGGGNSSENDTDSFLATNTSFTGNGNSNVQAGQHSGGSYSQQGTATTTSTSNDTTTQNTDHYSMSQQGTSHGTTNETAGVMLTAAGYATNAQVTQGTNTASTTSTSDIGNTTVSAPNGSQGQNINSIYYVVNQNSGATGSSTVVTNIVQSGQSLSMFGTFVTSQEGNNSAYNFNVDSYFTGFDSSPTSLSYTSGVAEYQMTANDSYTGGTQGGFDGGTVSGTFYSTQNGGANGGNNNRGKTIVVGSSGETSLDYSSNANNSMTAQYQSSGSFGPDGTNGTYTVSQSGGGYQGQGSLEVYDQLGTAQTPLPGGVYQVATVDEGTTSATVGADSTYVYGGGGNFSPSGSNGTYGYKQQVSEAGINGSIGALKGTTTGVSLYEGYVTYQTRWSAYTYQNTGSYTNSASSGTATLASDSGEITLSTAGEPFSTWSGTGTLEGTLSANSSANSSTNYASGTKYSPGTTSVYFSDLQTGNVSHSNATSYSIDGDGLSGAYSGASYSVNQTSNDTSGTAVAGTTVATGVSTESGSSGYTDSSATTSQAAGSTNTMSWWDSDAASSSQNVSTTSTTSPAGTVIALAQSFNTARGDVYNYGITGGISASFSNSSVTNDYGYNYTGGESYDSSSSQAGNAWGSGTNISSAVSFSTSQSLTDVSTTTSTTFTETFGSSNMTLASASAVNSVSSSQTYNDSGTMSSTGASQTVSDSPDYTGSVSRSGMLSTSSSASSTYSGQTDTSFSTETLASWTSATASQTADSSGTTDIYDAVGGSSMNATSSSTSGGTTDQTVFAQATTSNLTSSYTPSGQSYVEDGSVSSQATTDNNGTSTPTSGSSSTTYSVSSSMVYTPGISLLQEWLIVPGDGSGSGGPGSSSGSSGAGSSGAGSSGSWGLSGSSSGAGSSSSSGSSGLAGSSSSSSSSSSGSNNSGSPLGGVLNTLTQSTPQAASAGIYVPGGALTMPAGGFAPIPGQVAGAIPVSSTLGMLAAGAVGMQQANAQTPPYRAQDLRNLINLDQDMKSLLDAATDEGYTIRFAGPGATYDAYLDTNKKMFVLNRRVLTNKAAGASALLYEMIRYKNHKEKEALELKAQNGEITADQHAVESEKLSYKYMQEHHVMAANAVKNKTRDPSMDVYGPELQKGGEFATFEKYLELQKKRSGGAHYKNWYVQYKRLREMGKQQQ